MKQKAKIEFGDFQTPPPLAREVCSLLVQQGVEAGAVIEPTCGVGAFLSAAAGAFPKARLLGWDINPDYVEQTKALLNDSRLGKRASVSVQDFFAHDWETELAEIQGSILVLGNLPWVTNATVSGMNGSNLPVKENFQGFRGIEARTGKSNFDISEWMLIRLVKALRGRPATIAMLCKTGTARKLLRFAWQNDGRIAAASLYRIDAKKHFGASVDACLLLATTGEAGPSEAQVFDSLSATRAETTLGMAGQDLVSDIRTYRRLKHLKGLCPYQWRSGVKHDCASVMELRRSNGPGLENKLGEHISIEPDYLFPLLKCSDLANGRTEPGRFVIVTQRRVGEDTGIIAKTAPHTWDYLISHRELFEARRSSIYSSRVPFALFGIGDYSFAPWKVAVSGMHRTPRFALVGPVDDKPVLFDDTCYFLPFEDEHEAEVVEKILNSEECKEFLASLTFTDSKRPITVELLQRLNIRALAEDSGLLNKWTAARKGNVAYPKQSVSRQAELVMERPTR
ncbi:MAG TPA: class I SAM-dependent methyltransferase [Verrucomicrobiota bacterium]|nr:class I SAM-dependent methyltransferase [Verrucomicrobiota bacterium]